MHCYSSRQKHNGRFIEKLWVANITDPIIIYSSAILSKQLLNYHWNNYCTIFFFMTRVLTILKMVGWKCYVFKLNINDNYSIVFRASLKYCLMLIMNSLVELPYYIIRNPVKTYKNLNKYRNIYSFMYFQ